jgi:integrase
MTKASKGTVVVRGRGGRLTLCWTWTIELGGDGKRYEVAAGLNDNKTNRAIVQLKAKTIERDLLNGLFDPTLRKYRGQRATAVGVVELMDRFIRHKESYLYKDTLGKYRALRSSLKKYFGEKDCHQVEEKDAIGFRDSLAALAAETIKDKLVLTAAAWDWGLKEGLVTENPWLDLKAHKVPPRQIKEPFTATEVKRIIEGFQTSKDYSGYADYATFLLGTGCRSGEVSGLCWRHVSADCNEVWIGESVTVNGDRKAAKGNKSRRIEMTVRLQKMLTDRHRGEPGDPVFPAPGGGPINTRNFARRAWRSTLEAAGIDYDRPYAARHANATISIKIHGENPEMVAQRLGNSVRTLRGRYVGQVRGSTPDIFGSN